MAAKEPRRTRYYLDEVIDFVVRGVTYTSPVIGQKPATNEYLVLWTGGWPLCEGNIAERWQGFNLTSGHHNQKVATITFSQISGLSEGKKAQADSLKCNGPCGNFIHKAVPESDPEYKNGKPWWCRTCRVDHGYQRDI
jgi:hypothetical protein